jgi:ABC-type lipoprotein export system ATPase subunit
MSAELEILVDVRGAGRSYQTGGVTTAALRLATCTVHAGDRIALVGRSGSGKSTLLHLMAGLDAPTAGTVTWPALGDRQALRPERIGMMFQAQSLVPWLDVAENVALPLQLAGRTQRASDEAMAALQRFELDHLAGKLPEELSGGQAQRVSLVRALVTAPRLLLADEPTGQLDHKTAAHLLDTMFGWAEETGAALLVATHDPLVVKRFATRWQMQHGVLDNSLAEGIAA